YTHVCLHAAPGAQVGNQPFTGQYTTTPGFYTRYNYRRTYKFLEFMTTRIHTNDAYRNVGMFAVLNEPVGGYPTLTSEFYPHAYKAIRDREQALGITPNNYLHIQYMDRNWRAGDPNEALPADRVFVAYDNHIYPRFDPALDTTQEAYLNRSCNEVPNSDGQDPAMVGEWSIDPTDVVETSDDFDYEDNKDFYAKWWAAQVISYEKTMGWVFWTWKTQRGHDYRWSYTQAVDAGVIPKDPTDVYHMGVC
ncbi:glycoside hydrolase, partial [Pseudovirgaria hyperparasitica]